MEEYYYVTTSCHIYSGLCYVHVIDIFVQHINIYFLLAETKLCSIKHAAVFIVN